MQLWCGRWYLRPSLDFLPCRQKYLAGYISADAADPKLCESGLHGARCPNGRYRWMTDLLCGQKLFVCATQGGVTTEIIRLGNERVSRGKSTQQRHRDQLEDWSREAHDVHVLLR